MISSKMIPSSKQTETADQKRQNTANQQNGSALTPGDHEQPHRSLQRKLGNQAVQELAKRGELRGELTVGRPNDTSEREASQVANAVMGMPAPPVSISGNGANLSDSPEERVRIPRSERLSKRQSEFDVSTEQQINSLRDGGRPLPDSVRLFYESRFGQRFENVRVHTDEAAAAAAERLNAKAFTHRGDIYFARNQYRPNMPDGQRLLAHELTHVIQQSKSVYAPSLRRDSAATSELVAQRKPEQTRTPDRPLVAEISRAPVAVIQRENETTEEAARTTGQSSSPTPFTYAVLSNRWNILVNNWVNWSMRGLNAANLPDSEKGRAFGRGLASDVSWATVGFVAGLVPGGGTASSLAETAIEHAKRLRDLFTASTFNEIKDVIRDRLAAFSETVKTVDVKKRKIRYVLQQLGTEADQNDPADDQKAWELLAKELTGGLSSDTEISNKIHNEVLDRWSHFQEQLDLRKRLIREIRRRESFTHWAWRVWNGIGYWEEDDESPGLFVDPTAEPPEDYVRPELRQPSIRNPSPDIAVEWTWQGKTFKRSINEVLGGRYGY
jgi:hypothetical protein